MIKIKSYKIFGKINDNIGHVTVDSRIFNGESKWINHYQRVCVKITYDKNKIPKFFVMGNRTLNKIPLILTTSYEVSGWSKYYTKFYFIMPDENVTLYVTLEDILMKENIENNFETTDEENQFPDGVIDYFDIPDELAKELSELLTKQVVRERLLLQVVSDPVKYEELEKMIIPVIAKVEAIKMKITNEYVPEKYRAANYVWSYTGWEVDKNKVQVMEQK